MKKPDYASVSESGRVKYPRDYQEYASQWGYKSADAVRSWVRIGKKRGELPPLEDESEMLLWWRAYMDRSPPDCFLRAETIPPVPSEGELEVGESIELKLSEDSGSADEALQEARSLQRLCFEQLQAALLRGDHSSAERWRKDWTAAATTRRQWEKDYNRIAEERGHLVRKQHLLECLQFIGGIMSRMFIIVLMGTLKKVAPEMDRRERRELALQARDEWIDSLKGNEFAAAIVGGIRS